MPFCFKSMLGILLLSPASESFLNETFMKQTQSISNLQHYSFVYFFLCLNAYPLLLIFKMISLIHLFLVKFGISV